MSVNENTYTGRGVKCYNSISCISVILVILFILGSILFDMLVTKPEIRNSIDDIKIEIKSINHRLDINSVGIPVDSVKINDFPTDSI